MYWRIFQSFVPLALDSGVAIFEHKEHNCFPQKNPSTNVKSFNQCLIKDIFGGPVVQVKAEQQEGKGAEYISNTSLVHLIDFTPVRPDHELKIGFNSGDYPLFFFHILYAGGCIELQDQWVLEWDIHRTSFHIGHEVRVQISFHEWCRIQIIEDVVITVDGNF
jgi:hypothetical protein